LPTIDNNVIVENGSEVSHTFTSLLPNSTYFVRAFWQNNIGAFYSEEISFTTNAVVEILGLENVYVNEAKIRSYVPGSQNEIIAKGVCWSTSSEPTIDDNITDDSNASLNYVSYLEGLEAETQYFVRSYMTTEAGTVYSEEINFITFSGEISFEDFYVFDIGKNKINYNFNINPQGVNNEQGRYIQEFGVVYSSSQNPTINDNVITASNQTPSQTIQVTNNIAGLVINTTYYLRAYAIDSNQNIVYSSQIETKTAPTNLYVDIYDVSWVHNEEENTYQVQMQVEIIPEQLIYISNYEFHLIINWNPPSLSYANIRCYYFNNGDTYEDAECSQLSENIVQITSSPITQETWDEYGISEGDIVPLRAQLFYYSDSESDSSLSNGPLYGGFEDWLCAYE